MGNTKKKVKASTKKKLNSIVLLLALAAIILIISTYAWFSTQRNITITNLAGTVQVAEGMEISLDGIHWKQSVDLSQVTWTDTSETAEYPVYVGNKNNIPLYLQPVSTVGDVPASGDLLFYKGKYATGSYKLTDVTSCVPAITDGSTGVGVIYDSEAGEETDVGSLEYPAYYAFDVFIKNTIQNGTVDVGTEQEPKMVTPLQLYFDSYARVLEKATGDDNSIPTINWEENLTEEQIKSYTEKGLQNTVRIGFAAFNNTADVVGADDYVCNTTVGNRIPDTEDAETLTLERNDTNTIRQISIWEPNSNDHIQGIYDDQIKYNVLWDEALATTEGHSEYNSWGADTQLNTYAITSNAGSVINQIYKYLKVSDDPVTYRNDIALQNTVKTTSKKITEEVDDGEGGTIEQTTIDYSELNEGVVNLYDTTVPVTTQNYTNSAVPFYIEPFKVSRVRIYLWLEGQDVDCLNIASMGHGVSVNIDLTTGEQVGLTSEDVNN